jgi:hypothetical protein
MYMADLNKLMEKIRIAKRDNSRVIFHGAKLQGADLRGVDLRGADLTGADLYEAILSSANLTDANLSGANLLDANLSGANLSRANLIQANLEGAYLARANLTQANLTGADLTEADFTNSVLMVTNLTGATRTNAIFTGVDLTSIINYSAQNPAPVDSNQVHKSASKIDYNKINEFLKLKTKTGPIPSDINYPEFIRDKFNGFISHIVDQDEKEKTMTGFNAIMVDRLNGLDYETLSPYMRDSIFYALTYVSNQSPTFQEMYAKTFIQDCVEAYNGPNGMTCALGGIERILFSLLPPCAGSESEDCETIRSIIAANPDKLVEMYIHDWYKLHHKDGEHKFQEGVDKRANLIVFLKEKLPGMVNDWIQSKVESFADPIGYDDDDFDFKGGRKKRRTKKRLAKKRLTKKRRLTKTHRMKKRIGKTKYKRTGRR